MALTVAFNSQVGINALRSPGLMIITVSTGGATYATATGGLTVDITTLLANTGLPAGPLFANMPAAAMGFSALGHLAALTKTSTSGQYTMRLWNGTTEFAEGAATQTVQVFFYFD